MKHTKIFAIGALLFGMAAEGQAQVFQVFQKDGGTQKFQAAAVDSLTHNDAEGLTTLHLSNGNKQTFPKEATDSIVWYDPSNSILAKLQKKGGYTNFLRLVQESAWWTDMMNGATDLTVFAADDAAWQRFFAENAKLPTPDPWHTATSFEALTADQKRILLHSAIAGASTTYYGKDMYIRNKSAVKGLDLLQHLSGSEVPVSYSTSEKWYWKRFHETNGGNGLYLVTDSCDRYTVVLTPEKAKWHNITEQDLAILFPQTSNRIANGTDLLQQDTASNGMVHSTATPLKPLQSMAEVIRTNGKTNIFSHILDRFSAPFYSPVLTESYKALHPDFTDSIFIKRYFSDNNYSVKAGYVQYDWNTYSMNKFEPGPFGTYQAYYPYIDNSGLDSELSGRVPGLKFDPGWTGYYDEQAPEMDMAAIFVPNDEEMWRYFTEGAGGRLLHVYYAREGRGESMGETTYTKPATQEELIHQIDSIPVGVLEKFINNMMQRSFAGSVPSKWGNLTDDAMELLFPNVNEALAQLDTCLLANNGMVYVMNRTCMTADFTSVAGPAYISNTCKIIKSAIYDAFMSLNYYAYLKAPQQDITFFLPSDEALRYYYDPISMKSRTPRVIQFTYKGGTFPVNLTFKNYYGLYNQDRGTLGTIGNNIPGSNLYENSEVTNRLKDILYNHTIVNDGTQDIHSRNEYYRTFGGDVVKVVRDTNGNIVGAKGSFQMENERLGIATGTPGVTECQVTESYESLSNGRTYTLNAPFVPTHRSLYSIMTNDANWTYMEGTGGETPYSEFYKLCSADAYGDEIIACGLVDETIYKTPTKKQSALKKYVTFISGNGLDYNLAWLIANTPFTAYIPTNEAVRRAIAQGLPTWDDIYNDFHSHCKPNIDEETGEPVVDYEGNIEYTNMLQSREDSIRIANKIITLTNVIRAHFHYGMAIADQEPFQREYKSLYIDEQTLASPKLKVNCTGGGNMTVTDWKGQTFNVLNKNVFVRDYSCNRTPIDVAMKGVTINSSRSGVIHQIDGVLGFK